MSITDFVRNDCSGSLAISSNVTLTVPAGSYEYCLAYNNPPLGAIPSFSIGWH